MTHFYLARRYYRATRDTPEEMAWIAMAPWWLHHIGHDERSWFETHGERLSLVTVDEALEEFFRQPAPLVLIGPLTPEMIPFVTFVRMRGYFVQM